nr:H518 [uncultured bacterium]
MAGDDPWPAIAEQHVRELIESGIQAQLVAIDGQGYLHVQGVEARGGAWEPEVVEILVGMPMAYDDANLDAFYLKLPYSYKGGGHERVQGAVIQWNDAQWQLVSWHYHEDQPWVPGRDTIASHLVHCMGFFPGRGAR